MATKAQLNKKGAKSAEKISAAERLLKIKTNEMTFRHISHHFVSGSFDKKSLGLSTYPASKLDTMSKKNLRRITLVITYIWKIHSLTLIISCFTIKSTEGSLAVSSIVVRLTPPPLLF